jgi:hypothetical protein
MATIPPEELTAAVEARKELGPDHEDAVVASFLARIQNEIDARVDQRLAGRQRTPAVHPAAPWPGFLLAFLTIGVLVPISETASTAGFIIAALAIAVVNVAYNLRRG